MDRTDVHHANVADDLIAKELLRPVERGSQTGRVECTYEGDRERQRDSGKKREPDPVSVHEGLLQEHGRTATDKV